MSTIKLTNDVTIESTSLRVHAIDWNNVLNDFPHTPTQEWTATQDCYLYGNGRNICFYLDGVSPYKTPLNMRYGTDRREVCLYVKKGTVIKCEGGYSDGAFTNCTVYGLK